MPEPTTSRLDIGTVSAIDPAVLVVPQGSLIEIEMYENFAGTLAIGDDVLIGQDESGRQVVISSAAGTTEDQVTGAGIADSAIRREHILEGAIDRTRIAQGEVTAALIAIDAIGETHIAPGAITSPSIAANAIAGYHIVANSISASQISAYSITAVNIAAQEIVAGHILTGTITADQIAVGTITANEIEGGTITASEIQSGTLSSASGVFGTISASDITTGILNADLSLHIPDFRAGERTFQLLTQVAGRAGRGELEGEVIIQTFTPHSPSVQFARHHDFDGYAEQELEFRRQFGFPPFTHCALLTARSTHERRAEFTLQSLHRRLSEGLPAGIILGEPLPSPLVKAHGQFRFQLTLRGPKARALSRHVQQVIEQNPVPEDVTVVFDMDALSFT